MFPVSVGMASPAFQDLGFPVPDFTRGIAGQPLLARLQEVLRPAVVEVLIDPFLAAQLGHAVLAAQARDHDPDLIFSREMPPGRPPYVAYRLLRLFRLRIDFRSHLPLLPRLKMSQKSSLPQSLETVQLVLTGNRLGCCVSVSESLKS